ncbi:MAG: S9 family peptidase [Acidobacteria bacterium]|nr:S9 family peptidase [Acidobacteriota bacterium]
MRLIYIIIALSIAFSGALLDPAASQAQARRAMAPTDLSVIRDVSDVQISPDGSKVVFVVSETAQDKSGQISHIWMAPANGGEVKRLTVWDAGETSPRWSPDGKWIAFYSDRDRKNGIWIFPAEGGEPRLVCHVMRTNFHLKGAGESLTWSPDSKRIAFISSPEILSEVLQQPAPPVDPKLAGLPPVVFRPLTREEIDKLPVEVREMIFRAQGQAMGKKAVSPLDNAVSALPDDPRVITRLQYKSRTSFSDNLRSHIIVADIETRRLSQLTDGIFYEHSINWSPKGDEIVFASNREPDPDKINNTDLFTVNVDTFAVRQLTRTKGCEWTPVFSPDGSEIAFTGTSREITTIDSVAEDAHVFIIPARGGAVRELNSEQDRRATSVKWAPDGKSVFFTASDHGKTLIYNAGNQRRPSAVFDKSVQVSSFSISNEGKIAFISSSPAEPAELFILKSSGEIARLSNINQQFLSMVKLTQPRQFAFKSDVGEVEAWLYPPADLAEGKKYPLILNIHGGPHGMFGYSFNSSAQVMAANGYAVLMVNPRGSSGYGQKFADGCINDWGGGDYRDLMRGVNEALGRFPFIDGDRMAVTGGSYGGYMTNWVITQSDRFKAAVASASLSNLISFYSTSLYQDLIHAEFNGYPWDNFDILWDRSPLKHVKNAKTPLLLLHGEQDNDVHMTQAEEMFTAMKMRGIESVLVRYPREGHGFREPRHREDSLARTLQWFDKYLKQN